MSYLRCKRGRASAPRDWLRRHFIHDRRAMSGSAFAPQTEVLLGRRVGKIEEYRVLPGDVVMRQPAGNHKQVATRPFDAAHGAIGTTDAYDLGLTVNRCVALVPWLGNARAHRQRYGSMAAPRERVAQPV